MLAKEVERDECAEGGMGAELAELSWLRRLRGYGVGEGYKGDGG